MKEKKPWRSRLAGVLALTIASLDTIACLLIPENQAQRRRARLDKKG